MQINWADGGEGIMWKRGDGYGIIMCKLKGVMEKGGHYVVEITGWMQKGGIIRCKLKGQMDK